ncbi:Histidinol dehydrogenase, chloroplastic, partial [Mucuna pruriens]
MFFFLREVVYCAKKAGVIHILKAGRVQVEKIFGPGNQYVKAAKMILQPWFSIDMPAGPSEVLVIADKHAIPHHVAANLLSQTELTGTEQLPSSVNYTDEGRQCSHYDSNKT